MKSASHAHQQNQGPHTQVTLVWIVYKIHRSLDYNDQLINDVISELADHRFSKYVLKDQSKCPQLLISHYKIVLI